MKLRRTIPSKRINVGVCEPLKRRLRLLSISTLNFMPRKIPFHTVYSSSDDEQHPASELNHHGPLVNGWQSSRFCTYPQELILQLESFTRIRNVQILSHQFLIGRRNPAGCLPTIVLVVSSLEDRILYWRLFTRREAVFGQCSLHSSRVLSSQ